MDKLILTGFLTVPRRLSEAPHNWEKARRTALEETLQGPPQSISRWGSFRNMVWCDGTWSRIISLPDSVCNATDPPMTWRKKGVLLHLDTWAHITEMAHVPLAFTNTHTQIYIYIYKDRIEPYKLRVWERILSKDCGHNFPWKPWAQLSLSGACRPEITWVMQTPIRRFNLRETVSQNQWDVLLAHEKKWTG